MLWNMLVKVCQAGHLVLMRTLRRYPLAAADTPRAAARTSLHGLPFTPRFEVEDARCRCRTIKTVARTGKWLSKAADGCQ